MDEDFSDKEQNFEIDMEGILKEYKPEDIEIFVQDLFFVFNILQNLDHEYGETDNHEIERDLKKFKNLVKDWNNKYRDIILDFKRTQLECKIDIFIIEKDAETLASVIKGMKRFNTLNLYEKKLDAAFQDIKGGENTLTFEIENRVFRLIYLKGDMLKPQSPEFRLCTYYAMKNGFEKTINLEKYKNMFSFDISTEESRQQEHGWQSRYRGINFGYGK
jgi:hypothetical protein